MYELSLDSQFLIFQICLDVNDYLLMLAFLTQIRMKAYP